MRTVGPSLLLYDDDCRVCSAFARTVAILAPGRSIRAQSIQASTPILAGMSGEEALAAAHLLAPDGILRTGPEVIPAILGALLANPKVEQRWNASPQARRASTRTYRLLVELRGRLSCVSGARASAGRSP
jgi:predicted DCC family thiol-disulfide oxidoreductase YuxK